MRRFLPFLVVFFLLIPSVFAAEEKNPSNLFAERFFMPSGERLRQKTQEIEEFLFVETPPSEKRGHFAVVTDSEQGALRSQLIPGPQDAKALRDWVKANEK